MRIFWHTEWALLSLLVALLCATFFLLPLEWSPARGEDPTAELEFTASAECNPHSDVEGPSSMTVLFLPIASSRSGIGQLSATLYSQDRNPQESVAQSWDFPQRGWHSVLFPGPLVKARFFCQDPLPVRNLSITYHHVSETKIAISQTSTLSKQELEQISPIEQKNILTVLPDNEEKSFYSAGEDTHTPYWLTFSLPVHSQHDISTTLKYSFP